MSEDLSKTNEEILALLLGHPSANNHLVYLGEPGNPHLLDSLLSHHQNPEKPSSPSSFKNDKNDYKKLSLNNINKSIEDSYVPVRIGDDYQVNMDKITENIPIPDDKLLWDPKVDSQTVEDFLRSTLTLSNNELPYGNHLRDDEYVLYTFLRLNYNKDLALKYLSKKPLKKSLGGWTEQECQEFEEGFLRCGKNFHQIKETSFLSKTIAQMVQFYYLWKKTERFDIVVTKSIKNKCKEKYTIEPGILKDIERFLPGRKHC